MSAAFSRRARSVSAAKQVVAGGEADAGADGGDVVQVAPDPLELEQDRAGTRASSAVGARPSASSQACA